LTDPEEKQVHLKFVRSHRLDKFVTILERYYLVEPLDSLGAPIRFTHKVDAAKKEVTLSGNIAYTLDFLKNAKLIDNETFEKLSSGLTSTLRL
jgi:hypothetical protein